MTTGYYAVLRTFSLLFLGLVLAACVQNPDTRQDPTLVYIDVGHDVGPASAQILVNGDRKGFVGPGCQLIFAVNAGVHTFVYQWDEGSVERDIEALAGKTLIVRISRGPTITLPKTLDDSDACSV